jgi:hypothetical protein
MGHWLLLRLILRLTRWLDQHSRIVKPAAPGFQQKTAMIFYRNKTLYCKKRLSQTAERYP